jgi:hypothetical protein
MPPWEWPIELPITADLLEGGDVWLVGYDGEFFDSTAADDDVGLPSKWQECPFSAADLSVGDRVGIQVSSEGYLEVGVNGEVVWTTYVPAAKETPALYGIVDLLGSNTQEVVLISHTPRAR